MWGKTLHTIHRRHTLRPYCNVFASTLLLRCSQKPDRCRKQDNPEKVLLFADSLDLLFQGATSACPSSASYAKAYWEHEADIIFQSDHVCFLPYGRKKLHRQYGNTPDTLSSAKWMIYGSIPWEQTRKQLTSSHPNHIPRIPFAHTNLETHIEHSRHFKDSAELEVGSSAMLGTTRWCIMEAFQISEHSIMHISFSERGALYKITSGSSKNIS